MNTYKYYQQIYAYINTGNEQVLILPVSHQSVFSKDLPPVSLDRPDIMGRNLSSIVDKSSSKFSNFSDDIFFISFSCDKQFCERGGNEWQLAISMGVVRSSMHVTDLGFWIWLVVILFRGTWIYRHYFKHLFKSICEATTTTKWHPWTNGIFFFFQDVFG